MPIRVLIVDRHEIMRAGIRLACHDRDEIQVVCEAESLAEAISLLAESGFDVLVIDPDCFNLDKAVTNTTASSLEQLQELHLAFPDLTILVFSSDENADLAAQIIQSGAAGFVTKQAGMEELSLAIRSTYQGRIFISHGREVPKPIQSRQKKRTRPVSPKASLPLSEREQEVLKMLAGGMTNKQVAGKLFLSVKTVETYRARIMKKHGLRDRSELVQLARDISIA